MMPDETIEEGDGKTGPQMKPHDSQRVNVNDDHDLIYWSSRFECTRDQLRAVVKDVGDSVSAVETALLKMK